MHSNQPFFLIGVLPWAYLVLPFLYKVAKLELLRSRLVFRSTNEVVWVSIYFKGFILGLTYKLKRRDEGERTPNIYSHRLMVFLLHCYGNMV